MKSASVLLLSPDLAKGPSYTMVQFSGALRSIGYRTRMAGPASGALWTPLRDELGPCLRLPDAGKLSRRAVSAAAELARESDALYAFKAWGGSFGVALRLRDLLGLPLVLHLDDLDSAFVHGVSPIRQFLGELRTIRSPRSAIWLRYWERRVGEADALTVSTTALQERFGGWVVRQGVNTDRYDSARFPREEARRRLGISRELFLALFVGTPTPLKGLPALESLAFGLGSTSEVWVVGVPDTTGAEATNGLRRFPPCAFDEGSWYMAAADVFVVPQLETEFTQHQLPAKIIHAMALGLPVVTTDVGDARMLLGGDKPAGSIVKPGCVDRLVEAVEALRTDEAGRAALSREARRRARESFGWSAMGRELVPVMRAILPRAGG